MTLVGRHDLSRAGPVPRGQRGHATPSACRFALLRSTRSVKLPQKWAEVLAAERYEVIVAALRSAGIASTDDLAGRLDVSVETVRRDLVVLERRGALHRVHGGATALSSFAGSEAGFTDRAGLEVAAKQRIGRRAAQLVQPGHTVVFDVGTTVLAAARALPADITVTVATCSLLVAAELAERPNIEVLVSGGRLRAGDLALSNARAVEFFADLHADVALLGSGGVDADAGLTDFHLDEVATRQAIIAAAARSYVLAAASKLDRVAPYRVCGLRDITGVVTDAGPSAELGRALEQSGGAVVLA